MFSVVMSLALSQQVCLPPEIVFCPPPPCIVPKKTPEQRVPYKDVTPPAVKVPYYERSTFIKKEALETIAKKPITPKIVYNGEITSTVYVNGVLSNGESIRVPAINGKLPRILLGYTNNVLVHSEFNFENGTPFKGQANDVVYFKEGRRIPSTEESFSSKNVEETRYKNKDYEFVADDAVAPPPNDTKKEKTIDDSLKRPNDVGK